MCYHVHVVQDVREREGEREREREREREIHKGKNTVDAR